MKTSVKIWIITAAALTLTGLLIFGGIMTVLGWDFKKLSTSNLETNTYGITGEFESISVSCATADVCFLPSEDEKASVVCYERENEKHTVRIADGTLLIERTDTRKWYEHIGINFNTPKITVYLPEGEYGALSIKATTGDTNIPRCFGFESIDIAVSTGRVECASSAAGAVNIKTTTGDIRVFGIACSSLDLSVSTGRITAENIDSTGSVKIGVSTGGVKLSDVKCKSLSSTGNTGDITLESVIASEKLSVERSTGDVVLSGSDAAEINIKTDTGDVRGTLLSEKVFIAKTDTGTVKVPKTTEGGKCEIATDTGDIKIEIKK